MDPLSGYYSPQQYTPVPLPTYPAPNFSAPSPYPRHHAIQAPSHLQEQYDLEQPQTLTLPQSQGYLGGQAPSQAAAHVQGLTQAARPPDEEGQAEEEGNDNVVAKKPKKGPAPKGFGRTSAVYRIDENGVKRRVNPEEFRVEVEERTVNGESCEQIADALIAQGAQVTSKSISRWRIAWGYRKRAVRKQSKPPKPQEERMNKKQIFQSKFKADITRMTQQGFTPEQIAQIMTSRGMELKKGSTTIIRLQTVWKLRGNEESRIKNKQYVSRRKARQQQLDEFNLYARELGLENAQEWVKQKMREPAVKDMRREAAFELMGDAAPDPKDPKEAKSTPGPSRPRTKRPASTPNIAQQPSVTDAAQVKTVIEDEYRAGEELTVNPAVITRAQRSNYALTNEGFGQDAVGTGSKSGGKNSGYNPMEGMSQAGEYDLADNTYHDYPALVDQENNNDDDSDDGDSDGGDEEDDDDNDDDDNDDDDDDDDDADDDVDDNDIDGDEVDEDNDQNMEGNVLSVESTRSGSASQPSGNFNHGNPEFVPSAQEQNSLMQIISVADVLLAAAQLVKDIHLARSQGRPGPRSRTGLPPSIRDMEMARHRLKESVQGTLNFLQDLD